MYPVPYHFLLKLNPERTQHNPAVQKTTTKTHPKTLTRSIYYRALSVLLCNVLDSLHPFEIRKSTKHSQHNPAYSSSGPNTITRENFNTTRTREHPAYIPPSLSRLYTNETQSRHNQSQVPVPSAAAPATWPGPIPFWQVYLGSRPLCKQVDREAR